MSNSALSNIGLRAMAAQFAGLQTTGQNIANASVKGYSRQVVQLANSPGQWQAGAFYGTGVDIASVTRLHDNFLTSESSHAGSLAQMDSSQLEQLQSLENAFKSGEGGLGDTTSRFFQALTDVSSQPGDQSSRRVALARASDLASGFNAAGRTLDSLQTGVGSSLQATVTQVNGLTQGIAALNRQIAAQTSLGQPPNDLLDQRDQMIATLSQQIRVSRVDASDGTTTLSVASGQPLVLGGTAASLQVEQDARDPTRSAVSMSNGPVKTSIDENTLGGGAIAGLLKFQNQDLVQGRNLLGRLAAAVGTAVNEQQAHGLSLQPPLGSVGGSPLFLLGQPQALPNAANARGAGGVPLGSVSLTITDASVLQASDYSLQAAAAPGQWQLTRLSDGKVSTVLSGDIVDGLRIDINNPQAGDKFLLQPVGRAGHDMQALLSDPRDLAAASPLVATTGASNIGTAAIAGLQVNALPLPTPGATVQIAFTDENGGFTWSLLDSVGAVIGGGNAVWQAGRPIPAPPQDFNGFSLLLAGVPRAGDTISVAPISAAGVATNNGNALSLVALRDGPLVDGSTANDAWAQALADVGVRVQSAKTASTISTGVAEQAEQARSSQSGVNLDEEAAKLIQYQQGYQAAAKVLSVAQTVFDTLLQTTGH